MAKISRRTLLQSAAFAGLGGRFAGGAARNFSIGVTDWNLRLGANPDALPLAARIGFEGVQVSFGRRIVNDKMPLDDPADHFPLPESLQRAQDSDRRNLRR